MPKVLKDYLNLNADGMTTNKKPHQKWGLPIN